MFVGIGANSPSGYDITDSLRFRASASAYLNRTPASAGNRKTFTISMWVKRGILGTNNAISLLEAWNGASSDYFAVGFTASDNFRMYNLVSNSYTLHIASNATYRDPSSWYHIVVAVDTTQATSTNRVKVYINGEQVTSLSTTVYPSLNADMWVNNNILHKIARNDDYAGNFDGYLTEINLVDGTALAPTDFGETDDNGTWIPKEYTGTYGTNGFYLPMKPTTQATGFNTVTYTGNGGTQSITGVGFTPDLVWVKNRDESSRFNLLTDTVRGATKSLASSLTATEADTTYSNGLTAFGTDGFSVGNLIDFNGSADKMVAWCWDAGGSTVTNTNGTIDSQVRANPATGFSIVSYTGTGAVATVGHGLASVPEMVICKRRNTAGGGWIIYHSGVASDAETYYMFLNSSAAAVDLNTVWNDTAPSSTVFTLGTNATANLSSEPNVAYCFADVTGYQKIGSYTGNGSTTGPVVDVGFEPAFVLIKRTDSARSWVIFDNTRNPVNERILSLEANNSDAEYTNDNAIDFVSNGFQPKSSGPSWNSSGGNYIYLAIADTRDAKFNFDASGNKNNWTPNNINSNASGESTYDLMSDVPTLTDEDTANFAVMNPVDISGTVTDGNLKTSVTASVGTKGTIAVSEGKWYWEVYVDSGVNHYLGAAPSTLSTQGYVPGNSFAINRLGNIYAAGSFVSKVGLASYGPGDVIGMAVDFDNKKVWWSLNGQFYTADSGTATTIANSVVEAGNNAYVFTALTDPEWTSWGASSSGTSVFSYNFGQRPFAYTPPTGFKKLNTFNLPDSTVKDGSDYFDTVLYSGNNGTQAITGVGFNPDFVWIKQITDTASHVLSDTVRGAGKSISSNLGDAEDTNNIYGYLSAFNSNGFTVTTGTSNAGRVNETSDNYAAWNWKAGGTAVSNTVGDIASTVSANTTAGFSIMTYTGTGSNATIGHGLGIAPKAVIVKARTNTYTSGFPTQINGIYGLRLSSTGANDAANGGVFFNNTAPTTSVFTVGISDETNESGWNFVAYAFAEVEGYSKFGSFIGNASANGPFVYTGFRPAFLLFKNASDTRNWGLIDSTRSPTNKTLSTLEPDIASVENTSDNFDFLSNGFRPVSTDPGGNGSGNTIVYLAFAENPFKNSNAR